MDTEREDLDGNNQDQLMDMDIDNNQFDAVHFYP